ncbi:DNAJ heat shock N-terminal domain-containing protein [Euphorbia peplus]|nr:DNAJ heat shock N-terminal domain-containing protein [Euphorbia peplus]
MSVPFISLYPFTDYHSCFNPNTTRCHPRIRCCAGKAASARVQRNYYELLGVATDSDSPQIKEAYRKLQKKHHPDIAGQKGHEHTIMLNEAYKVLMKEDLRRDYDASIGHFTMRNGTRNKNTMGFSSWKGPFRPQALFVDQNACIGCRECVYNASNTFVMDETTGCARVKVQFGDDDQKVQVSVDSCPVNCIHLVDKEELGVLEFLSQPKLKEGYGVFGQGWERPKNVFAAAKSFIKQLEQQPENFRNVQVEEETPAQAEARASASMKLKMESFSNIWNLLKVKFGFGHVE